MRRLPRLMRQSALTFYRRSAGNWNDDGSWSEGSVTSYDADGSLQPYKDKAEEQATLPEGLKALDARIYWTNAVVKTVEEFDLTNADTTFINGIEFVAYRIYDWDKLRDVRLNHTAVVLIRRGKVPTGGTSKPPSPPTPPPDPDSELGG